MRSFDALARATPVCGHKLLEASAGTGKTFAIEQLTLRMLLEGEQPPSLEEIALITFTRAAASDLRQRLREALITALQLLTQGRHDGLPDYLQELFESGEAVVYRAKQLLRCALYSFESAQIFTIHAFCQRLLADAGLAPPGSLLSNAELRRLVCDFLCTDLSPSFIHPSQLSSLWHSHPYNGESLEVIGAIAEVTGRGIPIAQQRSFKEGYLAFSTLLQGWPSLDAALLIADFAAEAPLYTGLFLRSGELKPEWSRKVERAAQLLATPELTVNDFAALLQNGIPWLEAFVAKNRAKKLKAQPLLHYPWLCKRLREEAEPIIREQTAEHYLIARLASGCQQLLKRYSAIEGCYTYDDLLRLTWEAAVSDDFCKKVRGRYRAVIVDEFQDTDPLQWKILEKLFLEDEWKGSLCLVGDPKQSIYAFRQADIYTYLAASEEVGEEAHSSLDTNYRSHPRLISSLNDFFDTERLPHLIALPSIGKALPCPAVKAGRGVSDFPLLPEEEVSITLVLTPMTGTKSSRSCEEEFWFPYIIAEIHRLMTAYNLKPASCAILVKDRFQGERIANALRECGLPIRLQRSNSLAQSPSVVVLQELLTAILKPHDLAAVKIALAGKLLRWSCADLLKLEDPEKLEAVLLRFYSWRTLLLEKNILSFLRAFFDSPIDLHDSITIGERLLSERDPEPFFQELWLVAELLLAWQKREDNLLDFFDQLPELCAQDTHSLPSGDGVTISTVHASKGLEYDVVFALGIAINTPLPEFFIRENGLLTPVAEGSLAHGANCREADAEKLRQLYVAATRARYVLHLFGAIPEKSSYEVGSFPPIFCYLMQLCGQEVTIPAIRNAMAGMVTRIVELSTALKSPRYTPMVQVPSLEAPPQQVATLTAEPLPISFTSLHAKEALVRTREEDLQTLPSGMEFGRFVHGLLEKTPWASNRPTCQRALHPIIAVSPYAASEEAIIDMIQAAFDAQLPSDHGDFCLRQVKENDLYREIEFLAQLPSHHLCTGVIDLFFSYQGRYYLLDWKSHWLGNDPQAYSTPSILSAVKSLKADKQLAIYSTAIKSYLALVEPTAFEECFGGCYVLFLRGLRAGSTEGVWHI